MRLSRLFTRTLRETPADAVIPSHQLLLRAGYIHPLGAGIFTLLPLGKRAVHKIERIMREEIEAIGGQEMSMPVVNPGDVWKASHRYYEVGDEMARFTDRGGRDMVLAMTHEEVVAHVARDVVQSYRQLPALVYHIQTKWRDDPRPRAGLIRVREFTMKDSYSLDSDEAGLDRQYQAHYEAYFKIFGRCGLPTVAVLADVGMMGGSASHEFMYLTPVGEDTLLICDGCGHMANRQIAPFRKPTPPAESPRPVRRVATPNVATIAELADYLDIPASRTAKAVFLVATKAGESPDASPADEERFVFAVVRGDMELSENKLRNAIRAKELRPATTDEIRATGAVPGYASPVGLDQVLVVVDDLVAAAPNLVAGANEEGYHLENVNHGRDFQAQVVADIVSAEEGYACPECGQPMATRRGVEVGNIFKLGTRYSEALGCHFLDRDGVERPILMGSYGIGSGRLLACIAEEHHDDHGVIWPVSVAPYQVHLVALPGGQEAADRVYDELTGAEIEVLYDDREESAGVKFNDADLIGLPIRFTVSKRSLKNDAAECKLRAAADREEVGLGDVLAKTESLIARMHEDLRSGERSGRPSVRQSARSTTGA